MAAIAVTAAVLVRAVDVPALVPLVELVHECLPLLLSSTEDRIDGAHDLWVSFS